MYIEIFAIYEEMTLLLILHISSKLHNMSIMAREKSVKSSHFWYYIHLDFF